MAATSWQRLCARRCQARILSGASHREGPENALGTARLPRLCPPQSPAEVPHPSDPKTRSQAKGNVCRPAGTPPFLLGQRQRCSEPAPGRRLRCSRGGGERGGLFRVPGDGARLPPAASAGSASGAGDKGLPGTFSKSPWKAPATPRPSPPGIPECPGPSCPSPALAAPSASGFRMKEPLFFP